ncbi:DUF1801 domain-containing protein [Ferruginibacter sp.]|nr:DUF1801 domain-containing protein [Ferruginibacter sp.]
MPGPIKKDERKTAKKKMQNVSFRNMEEFLEFLPEDELKTVTILRKLVLHCIPECTEKLSYNVPFYKKHSNICFIWPSCVTWGEKMNQRGVRFGFSKGYLLTDETGYLDKGSRKQVYWRDFTSVKEIDVDLLKAYIYEAAAIDEEKLSKK